MIHIKTEEECTSMLAEIFYTLKELGATKLIEKTQKEVIKLSDLFDKQLEKLRSCGYTDNFVLGNLQEQKKRIIVKAIETNSPDCIPFIPVIPISFMTLKNQMEMIQSPEGDKKGICKFEADYFKDLIKTSDNPYYIFNVGVVDETCERSGLTITELIAYCIHNPSLELFLSRYGRWANYYFLVALNSQFCRKNSGELVFCPSGDGPWIGEIEKDSRKLREAVSCNR